MNLRTTVATEQPAVKAEQQSRTSYVLTDPAGGFAVATRGRPLEIAISDHEDPAVHRAAMDLAKDIRTVSGAEPSLSDGSSAERIIVGTIGTSPAVDAAISAGRLDVSALRDDDGELRWEAFLVSVVDDVLFLVGADRRGTVYAVYDFVEELGVSPWHWWGDVPIRQRDRIAVASDTHHVDWPSVRLRGIFLNDEEEFYHWAQAHTPDGTIGPVAYERIFELILRLKGNYLWAAMHVGAFNDDLENGRLADEMGVIVGTQHCDMLLRSNEHEFRPWVARRGEDVRYDYSIEGRNRELLQDYWRESVQQNRDYEVTWTVGMRGVHDSGFITAAIDDDGTLNDDEKLTARVALLEKIIQDQRTLLSVELGADPTEIPQLFIPYKEVLPLYDAGLQVPDDVTVVWANDSFGHIRRLPREEERDRSGGHGLYYHSSYWSNYITSYLATSSTPLALMKAELRRAWEGGIRRLWVDNIGGLKPLEIEMEFFLRSAWEAGKETTTADVPAFVAQWIDSKFTGRHGDRAGTIYAAYYQLNNQRKIEHLTSDVFPQTGYGDEAGRRLRAFRRLYDETNEILLGLPEDERDAFFQLFAVKIHLAYFTNAEFYYADRSTRSAAQGKPSSADRYLDVSRAFAESARTLIHHYNHVMSDGRWSGMFTPHAFPPPVMPLHPAATPALEIGTPGLGVVVWGTEGAGSRLTFSPHGTETKWIEVHNTGGGVLDYEIQADPWIEVGRHEGSVETEVRIPVRVRHAERTLPRTGRIRVSSPSLGTVRTVTVTLSEAADVALDYRGWLEADSFISIDPTRPDSSRDGAKSRWVSTPHLGRYSNGVIEPQPVRESGGAGDATLNFNFHLVTAGSHELELHRLPTLNSIGRIRVGVSVDGGVPVTVETETTDEHRGSWSAAIQDNVERLSLRLPWMDAGPHVLTLHAVDDHVAFSKLVLYTGDRRPTNLGPDFSVRSDRPKQTEPDPDPADVSSSRILTEAAELYRFSPSDLPHPDQTYADRAFWDGDTTFRLPLSVPQLRSGEAVAYTTGAGGKDVIGALHAGAVVESDGILAFEAENALSQGDSAWLTPGTAGEQWTHTQAETADGTGLAMHVRPRGLRWDSPLTAPGLNFRIRVSRAGIYRLWLLVKFDDDTDDSCVIAVDGVHQPIEEQFSRGALCEYGLRQRWLWAQISNVELTEGEHTLTILGRESGFRVDRVYLTLGDELPPVDAEWKASRRDARGLAARNV
ncbi:glycosyl hydrolase 115 family protein [Microbacterium invictum]|uniref:Gylcosyl hydrolase 115 C-terminal domain-containing protein n=1 Tax=Microbacterium invictum TaxID=515415 RepID=A0AA40SR32_9MICO|nr:MULTISPECIES: glycosyl hydrolase 115 family protein [Microbacterium]MBB4140826.1 hypothetical protein [Microbacterium invictum]